MDDISKLLSSIKSRSLSPAGVLRYISMLSDSIKSLIDDKQKDVIDILMPLGSIKSENVPVKLKKIDISMPLGSIKSPKRYGTIDTNYIYFNAIRFD